jgi:hypothetical protein
MKGLELCESYFREEGQPVLEREFGQLFNRMAIGLVGDGSECYGYDDEISRDHDWGPGFCIWLTKGDYKDAGGKIQEVYDGLPRTYKGFSQRLRSQWGGGRVGVLEIGAFYSGFVGKYQPPANDEEWLLLPENGLAAATNGEVFQDTLGEFTKIRYALLQFYPEDTRLKKIASRCMTIGREGQYNFPRCVKRGEFYAAQYAETKFCADAMSMVFLLNKRYAPFYKWIHRAVQELPFLGDYFHQNVSNLVEERDYSAKTQRIEAMSQALINELKRQGLSDHHSDYLPDHGPVVQQAIQDKGLRERNVWIG